MDSVRGPGFDYQLIRRRGQKRINIRISQNGTVTVSAPGELDDARIASTVAAKRSWVLKHLDALQRNRERNNPLKNLLLRGRTYPVTLIRGRRKRGHVLIDDEGVTVETIDGSEEQSSAVLEKWLKNLCREEMEARTRSLSQHLDIPIRRIYFRNQRTRWGSSSGKGNISLNWRIIMLPPPIQDYLIVHELCHQRHLNHSAAYWSLVERLYPGYRKAEAWLKSNRGIMGLFRE